MIAGASIDTQHIEPPYTQIAPCSPFGRIGDNFAGGLYSSIENNPIDRDRAIYT